MIGACVSYTHACPCNTQEPGYVHWHPCVYQQCTCVTHTCISVYIETVKYAHVPYICARLSIYRRQCACCQCMCVTHSCMSLYAHALVCLLCVHAQSHSLCRHTACTAVSSIPGRQADNTCSSAACLYYTLGGGSTVCTQAHP